MRNFLKTICKVVTIVTLFMILPSLYLPAQDRDQTITIHLRGVAESKISLLALSKNGTFNSITEVKSIRNGETTMLSVSKETLPGEFVLRFDYMEKASGDPYPSEKYLFLNNQHLEFWVNPMYVNHPDSTFFQQGERENATFARFSKENGRRKETLAVLQQFLMNYDDTKTKFYRQGTEEFEHRRQAYNEWLDSCVQSDQDLFVSSLYRFEFVPEIRWEGTEKERFTRVIDHYFDGIDFSDPFITKTSRITTWMNSYVNLYGQMATTLALRDSLFPLAGRRAVEHARKGTPIVYGWMVDYFYRGFESNNIPAGMRVLEPYLNDPGCLTSKRMEIQRRLKGIETLVPGSMAPDFELKEADGGQFDFYTYNPSTKYILLVFWSAGCSHCLETVNALFPWWQSNDVRQQVSVAAIGLDESEADVQLWEQMIPGLEGWKHLHAAEGVRSQVANDYFILATPVMILVDAKTKNIIALPNTLNELMAII